MVWGKKKKKCQNNIRIRCNFLPWSLGFRRSGPWETGRQLQTFQNHHQIKMIGRRTDSSIVRYQRKVTVFWGTQFPQQRVNTSGVQGISRAGDDDALHLQWWVVTNPHVKVFLGWSNGLLCLGNVGAGWSNFNDKGSLRNWMRSSQY